MSIKTAIRYDTELTEVAKDIFGDIVDKAYITTWAEYSDKDEVISRLDSNRFIKNEDGSISYDAETIWIKFTNGRLIEFQNSEWAYIRLVNMNEAYEV